MALSLETLERRFDAAFGVSRTESDRDARLAKRLQELERNYEKLEKAYRVEDAIRWENEELRRQLEAHDITPFVDWPGNEDG